MFTLKASYFACFPVFVLILSQPAAGYSFIFTGQTKDWSQSYETLYQQVNMHLSQTVEQFL